MFDHGLTLRHDLIHIIAAPRAWQGTRNRPWGIVTGIWSCCHALVQLIDVCLAGALEIEQRRSKATQMREVPHPPVNRIAYAKGQVCGGSQAEQGPHAYGKHA